MPYSINKFDGTTVTVVEDGTINSTLDIKLVGKDYPGYGEIQNENMVFLLENFAGNSQPPRPLNGQLWYDASDRKIKVYDKLGQKWRATGSAEVSGTPPVGLGTGDFWWDSTELKLYMSNGNNNYILIGPQSVYNQGVTQMKSRGVPDQFGSNHAVIEAYSNGVLINIISNDAFTLHPDIITEYSNRFTNIKKGLNLAFTDSDGISTVTDVRYWGTGSDSDRLGGLLPSAYVLASNASFPDGGYYLGDDNDLRVYMTGDNNDISNHFPVIENTLDSKIAFKVRHSSSTITPLMINGNMVIPGTDDTIKLGDPSYRFNTVYASTFEGISTKADTVKVGTSYYGASIGAAASTIASRDNSGNLTANVFNGVATSARYADLAEKYIPDADYEVGTVMMVGGTKEVTSSIKGSRAIGVISANPAYMMNSDLEGGVYIALKGRVPVRMLGKVKKGDKLVAWDNGLAISSTESSDTFAIAMETSDTTGIHVIEAIIL